MHPEHKLTDTERRLEALENLLLFGGGVASGAASVIGLRTPFGGQVARAVPGVASRFIGKHPLASLLALGYAAHKAGLSPAETAIMAAEEAVTMVPGTPQWWLEQLPTIEQSVATIQSYVPAGGLPVVSPGARPTKLQKALIKRLGIRDRPTKLGGIFMPGKKRKVSKANRAVKQAMTWLKAGTKATSGAKPGRLPAGAFKTAVMAAGRANPNTKSQIGKGKSKMSKLARRLKKWW